MKIFKKELLTMLKALRTKINSYKEEGSNPLSLRANIPTNSPTSNIKKKKKLLKDCIHIFFSYTNRIWITNMRDI